MEANSSRALHEGHSQTARGEDEICAKTEEGFRQQDDLSVIGCKKVKLLTNIFYKSFEYLEG